MKKWQIENSEKSEISEISENYSKFSYFRVFDFALQSNRKLRFKNLGKKISKFSEFLTWLMQVPSKSYKKPLFWSTKIQMSPKLLGQILKNEPI